MDLVQVVMHSDPWHYGLALVTLYRQLEQLHIHFLPHSQRCSSFSASLAWGLGMEGLDAWVVVLVLGLEIVTPQLFNL